MRETYEQDVSERPMSMRAERLVLGCMMLEPAAIADAMALLRAEDFALDSHRRIYAVIAAMAAEARAVDSETVLEELRRKSELEAVGGIAYLFELTDGLPRKLNVESYVGIVADYARRRRLQVIGEAMMQDAADGSLATEEMLDRHRRNLDDVTASGGDVEMKPVAEFLAGAELSGGSLAESMAARDGVRLGWTQLDEATGGLQPGELIVVAGRPSMGKTAWACNAASHAAARLGLPTAFFSLEQKQAAMVRRMIAASARVDYRAIREGTLSAHDRALFDERVEMLRPAPLYIADQPGMTVTRIRARCLRLQRTAGLSIVFIDQLSKVSGDDVFQRGMSLREVVGKQTAALKRLAQELDVPVVIFNQISREAGKRGGDNRPQLANLAESGNIEQDADVVVLLHRPEYYDRTDDTLRGKGEMIVAKQREGPTTTCHCVYQDRILRWEDEYEAPAARQDRFSEDAYYGAYGREGSG